MSFKFEVNYYDFNNYYVITKKSQGKTLLYKGYGTKVMFMTPQKSNLYKVKVYNSLETANLELNSIKSRTNDKVKVEKLSKFYISVSPTVEIIFNPEKLVKITYFNPEKYYNKSSNIILLKNLKKEGIRTNHFKAIDDAIASHQQACDLFKAKIVAYNNQTNELKTKVNSYQEELNSLIKEKDTLNNEIQKVIDSYKNEELELIYGV